MAAAGIGTDSSNATASTRLRADSLGTSRAERVMIDREEQAEPSLLVLFGYLCIWIGIIWLACRVIER